MSQGHDLDALLRQTDRYTNGQNRNDKSFY